MTAGALPADDHVHTEWSWDATAGSMERSCARAVELGLPSIAFTEHLDLTRWVIAPEAKARMRPHAARVGADGRFLVAALDVDSYLACLQRCRDRYPDLRILSGVELGEPHWFEAQVRATLAAGRYDRVLGSLHSLEVEGDPWLVDDLYEDFAPDGIEPGGIVRAYLAEALRMVESSGDFAVLAHIDYPERRWPAAAGSFDAAAFEEEYRAVLGALARSGRALEVNTVVPARPEIVRWWREAGGQAVSFGSDAHTPSLVAHEFARAAAMVEANGFRPGRLPHDLWRRRP
jgi:histidinol-phosphatase (PHP family)